MKYLFVLVILLGAPALRAERNRNETDSAKQGIYFSEAMNWNQVLAKAKKENKNIFVDCYTTWCGPCKKMEQEVYPLPQVGDYFNATFISVKMQMDSTASDNAEVRSHYSDAKYLLDKYDVRLFPTYLVFTPDGRILNKDGGARGADEFIAMAKAMIDPAKNYYAVLELFHQGKTNLEQTSWLARQGLVLGDTTGSQEVGKQYILRLNKDSLLTKPNISFMYTFTTKSSEIGFPIFYKNVDSINKIMGDDVYAQDFVGGIIYSEMVMPYLRQAKKSGQEPDWNKMYADIKNKYSEFYADRAVIGVRSDWAYDHKNNIEGSKYFILYVEKYQSKIDSGELASYRLNNNAWQIFLTSNNKAELEKALEWSGKAVLIVPAANWMDTYANILYKLGRTKAALNWEDAAQTMAPKTNDIKNNFEKMKKGLPTWPTD